MLAQMWSDEGPKEPLTLEGRLWPNVRREGQRQSVGIKKGTKV